LKRRLKADKKAKEKAEKSAAAAAVASTAVSEPSQSIKEMEDIDPNVSSLTPTCVQLTPKIFENFSCPRDFEIPKTLSSAV